MSITWDDCVSKTKEILFRNLEVGGFCKLLPDGQVYQKRGPNRYIVLTDRIHGRDYANEAKRSDYVWDNLDYYVIPVKLTIKVERILQ